VSKICRPVGGTAFMTILGLPASWSIFLTVPVLSGKIISRKNFYRKSFYGKNFYGNPGGETAAHHGGAV
jgi:hypothetical protein